MVHFNVPPETPTAEVDLHKCQHAFVIVGDDTLFAVHMTQFWHEAHKYQLVFRLGVSPEVRAALREVRRSHPDAALIWCNDGGPDAFAVPSMVTARDPTFRGAIYLGIRPPPEEPPPHFFPWSRDLVLPVIDDVTITVEHVVLFRPFAHCEGFPDHPLYLLWGADDEAHMTRLQTARLLTGPFEAPRYGMDVDHIMSLHSRPAWLGPEIMASGVVISLPDVPRTDDHGAPVITEDPPFAPGHEITVLYRGTGAPRRITAATCWLWGGLVSNSPEYMAAPGNSLRLTEMPRQYWR
ncbi:hypothetical protein SAMN05421688_2093 [Poseidonocella pacifica]|uniref:Uncharacterized protein n=1 Tax=Poseidonocella pacifica TaxID=871651 RepID=A0A1I0XB90_9RHOB|nr:hypothetical protein [Poseidonocella pacifica]SFA98349.1 hypothetical protein SAMN05421688_2093 [Poseidonocella pacifica]